MSQPLFRQTALDSLATPEQLDKMIKVTDSRGWLVLLAIGLLLSGAVGWGIFGTIPQIVPASGVLYQENSNQPLQAIVFVDFQSAAKLQTGQKVQISPFNVPTADYGFLEGTITSVAGLPADTATLTKFFSSTELATAFVGTSPVLKVEVKLDYAANNQLQWSSGKSPTVTITKGTPVKASLILGQKSPLSLILPN